MSSKMADVFHELVMQFYKHEWFIAKKWLRNYFTSNQMRRVYDIMNMLQLLNLAVIIGDKWSMSSKVCTLYNVNWENMYIPPMYQDLEKEEDPAFINWN